MWNESPCLLSTEVKRVGHMVFRFLLWVVHVYISYGEHTKHVHGSAFVDVIRRQRVHFLFLAWHHESKKKTCTCEEGPNEPHVCSQDGGESISAQSQGKVGWYGVHTETHAHLRMDKHIQMHTD